HVGVGRRRQLLGLGDVADERLVFAKSLDQWFEVGQRFRLLPVLGLIALHLGAAEELHDSLVLSLNRCQLIEHFLPCGGALPPAPVPRPSTMLGTTLSLPKSRGFVSLSHVTTHPRPVAGTPPHRRRRARCPFGRSRNSRHSNSTARTARVRDSR